MPLVALVVGAVLCAVATAMTRRFSGAIGFVDHPGGHKGHDRPVALGGGVALAVAVLLPILIGVLAAKALAGGPVSWLPAAIAPHLGGIVAKASLALAICGAAAGLCVLGLIDDRRPLSPMLRLCVQAAIAAILVVGFDLRLLSHLPPVASIGLSILWILVLTNAFNFLDNMDGLAAGVAAIAAIVFGLTAALSGQLFVPTCCGLLAGALLGFLPFNFHPATIYLGDAGSTVTGLLLAVFTILTTFVSPDRGAEPIAAIAPLIVMAVPLYDTASVFYLRRRSGVPVWRGDRRHFSHRLVARGLSVPKAVLVIWLATLATALPALLLPHAGWFEAGLILVQTGLVVGLVAMLESSGSHGKV